MRLFFISIEGCESMANDQSIRSLMNSAGYDNNKIGYNPDTNTVTYDNRPFYKGGMNVNGTVFTDKNAFDQAHNQYQKSFGPGTIFTADDDSVPYEQRLANYATNRNAGQKEYNRATQVSKYNQATGANNADTLAHINRLQQILGVDPNANPYDQQYNDLIGTIMNKVNNPQPYDVFGSPEYAAAKAAADRGAQQDVRRAQESLGASGFGRSTNLQDRAQSIQNDATNYLLSQVVPQLIGQHNQQEQQSLSNLFPVLNALGQQQQTYDTRQQNKFSNDMETKKFDYGVQKDERDFGYTKEQDALAQRNLEEEKAYRSQRNEVEDQKWLAEYQRSGEQFAAQMGINWANLNQRQQEFVADEAYKYAALAAQNDPNSLDNRYKQAQIDQLTSKTTPADDGIDQYDLAMVNTLAQKAGIDPTKATSSEIMNFVAGLKGQYGWSKEEADAVSNYLTSQKTADSGSGGIDRAQALDYLKRGALGAGSTLPVIGPIISAGNAGNALGKAIEGIKKQIEKLK
jgi:hypothetical protein